jgi:MoaA/NifB/PqqE/SkfB family radical SAM enzyme
MITKEIEILKNKIKKQAIIREEYFQLKKKKTLKYLNFIRSYNYTFLNETSLFLRVLPTDSCNLNCVYCFQKKNSTPNMSWDFFNQVIEKAIDLKVGMISFLGGEPMLWEHLYDAVALCSKHNILTDMTTNGTMLNETTIQKLGEARLNYLNISVDTRDNFSVTKKNSLFDKNTVQALKTAEKNHCMKLRMNGVIYNNNFDDIKLLLEISNGNKIPLSLGFIVPNFKNIDNKEIYFSEKDTELLEEIVNYILKKKEANYPVIDPVSYFTNVFRFIKNDSFWNCNYPTKYGWINITANGEIRGCTKKMDETGMNFLALTPEKIKVLKNSLETSIKDCNPFCYSNCAYDSSFYVNNKMAFFAEYLKKYWNKLSQ